MLTEHQRDMIRQPFLGSYLFCWHQNERKALELLEQKSSAPESLHLALSVWCAAVSVSRTPERSPVDENDRCGKIPPAVGCI